MSGTDGLETMGGGGNVCSTDHTLAKPASWLENSTCHFFLLFI